MPTYNITKLFSFNYGFSYFDVLRTIVGYISYNISNRDLPGIYALT